MQNFISLLLVSLLVTGNIHGQTLSKETVVIETSYGIMKVKLYEETPIHKINFLRLVNNRVFDSLLFHRVINNFMIQGGDPLSKHAKSGDSLGHGDLGYVVPAEFHPKLIHQKGRLCAARNGDDINPDQASSPSQFYLVQGKKRTMEDLLKYEARINKAYFIKCGYDFNRSDEGRKLKELEWRLMKEGKSDSIVALTTLYGKKIHELYRKRPEYKFNQHQIDTYLNIGGTPHLDGTYTVFGEVIEGIEVIDKIAAVQTDKRDRPVANIRMKIYLAK